MNGPSLAMVGVVLGLAVVLDISFVLWLRARGRSPGDERNHRRRQAPRPQTSTADALHPTSAPDSESRGSHPGQAGGHTTHTPWLRSLVRYFRTEILPVRLQRERIAVALGGLVVSTVIGLAYGRSVVVRGWQLWVWGTAVAATCVALLPPRSPGWPRRPPWGWLLGLSLGGLLLRVAFLGTVPGWLHPDESMLAEYTLLQVLPAPGITVNPFSMGIAGQPALHAYIVRLALHSLGRSILALRIPSVIAGSLAIPAIYAAIASIDSRRTAILGAVLATAYPLHVHWSRLALSTVWNTLWVPLALAAFCWGWRREWSGGGVLAGLALGLSFYFPPGIGIGLILLAVLAIVLYREDPDRRRLGVHLGKVAAVATCTAAPILLFIVLNPEGYLFRQSTAWGWTPEAVRQIAGASNRWLEYFWHQFTRSFGAYTTFADMSGFYDPGVAFLFGVSALAFMAGVFLSVRRRRWLPPAWVILTSLLGGFVMREVPSSASYVISIPGILWLVALPLDALMSRGHRSLALALLAAILVTDLVFYFGVYALHGAPALIFPFPVSSRLPGG